MKQPYIILPRDFFQTSAWMESRIYSEAEAWLDIIRSVRFDDTPCTQKRARRSITWQKDEWPVSQVFLSQRWQWTIAHVMRFLRHLCEKGLISLRVENKTTIIRLTYSTLQQIVHPSDDEGDSHNNTPPTVNVAVCATAQASEQATEQTSEETEQCVCKNLKTSEIPSETASSSTDERIDEHATAQATAQVNKNKEYKNNNNNSSPISHTRTCVKDENHELLNNQQWVELMCLRHHLTPEQLAEKLDYFALDCGCRGLECHTNLRDAQQHFNNWLLKLQKEEKSQTVPPGYPAHSGMPSLPQRNAPMPSSYYIAEAQQRAMQMTEQIILAAQMKRQQPGMR